jgi:SecD/SecF fusion protein
MNSRLRWRVVSTCVMTLVISCCAWYPFVADRFGWPTPAFVQQKRLRLGLDLKGGVHMVLRVNTDDCVPPEGLSTAIGDDLARIREDTVRQARQTVERRVNELGVGEPQIAIQGAARNEIVVQLPGITDMDRARAILGRTALLEWKLVERGPAASRDALLRPSGGPAEH